MANDFYKTLGVARDASEADIRKAYLDLARKYHPDVNKDDKTATKKFQEVQAAFDVLGDQKKRELYDRYGSSFEHAGAGGPGGRRGPSGAAGPEFEDAEFAQFFGERFGDGPQGGFSGTASGGGFADIFEQLRKAQQPRGGRGTRPRRGADVESRIEVPFVTAVTGGETQISVRRPSGKVENITVKIPAGIEDGKRIRLRGQGEPGAAGGPPGDMFIAVNTASHPFFERRGKNLHVKAPVTLGEAAAGAKIDIPTPRGVVSLRVPPGTSSGARLRVKGYGVAPRDKDPGDLLAEIQIVLPHELDEESRQWLQEFDRRHPLNPRGDLRW